MDTETAETVARMKARIEKAHQAIERMMERVEMAFDGSLDETMMPGQAVSPLEHQKIGKLLWGSAGAVAAFGRLVQLQARLMTFELALVRFTLPFAPPPPVSEDLIPLPLTQLDIDILVSEVERLKRRRSFKGECAMDGGLPEHGTGPPA